jgi:hypothetical protein
MYHDVNINNNHAAAAMLRPPQWLGSAYGALFSMTHAWLNPLLAAWYVVLAAAAAAATAAAVGLVVASGCSGLGPVSSSICS